MRNSYKLAVLALLGLAATSTAFAADHKSPMDFVIKEIGKNDNAVIEGRQTDDSSYVTRYTLDYGPNTKNAVKFSDKLLKKFGPPTSVRRDLLVWEMENPDYNFGQDEMVTIMIGPEHNGQYKLVVDRRGPEIGNNPRLRRKPKLAQPVKKQVLTQTPPKKAAISEF